MASSLLAKAKAQQAEKERKAKEAEAEKKRREAEERLIGSHPIVKMGVGRDVRDAYFQGLVFAAFADDNKVDQSERNKLARVAKTLAVDEDEVDGAIETLMKMGDEAKLSLGEEVAKMLGGTECALPFLCEFSLMWMAHDSYDQKSLCEWREQLAKWGMQYPEKWFARFDEVVATVKDSPKALLELEGKLSEAMIVHLFSGMVDDMARKLKAAKAAVAAAAQRRRHARRQNQLLEEVMGEIVAGFSCKRNVEAEDLQYVSDRVSEIDAKVIDWPAVVNGLLTSRMDRCKIVWKLIVLLMLDDWEPKLSQMTDELKGLLSEWHQSRQDWKPNLEEVIGKYLGDQVELS